MVEHQFCELLHNTVGVKLQISPKAIRMVTRKVLNYTRSLAPTDFCDAVFTCVIFQKVALGKYGVKRMGCISNRRAGNENTAD